MKELYLDNSATTKVYPRVVKVMDRVMLADYGNPSSAHALGDKASKIVSSSRTKIANSLGAKKHEIFFTSGTTESNNWAISGLASANPTKKKIMISSIEHPSVREVCKSLKKLRYKIVEIPVNNEGFVDLKFIEENIDSNTLLVSIIHGNNIFGTVQNLKKIGDICRKNKVLFHTDAAQTFGKLKTLVHDWNIDLLSASGHKIGGPKGIGFLYIREGIKINPLIYGGGQEKGLRSGTENVAGIVGLDKALEITLKKNWTTVSNNRNYLIEKLESIGARLIGSQIDRVPNNIFVTLPNVNAERLLYDLSNKGVYVSVESACDSKKETEDHALQSIGLSSKEMKSSIRISLPAEVTKKDIDYFLRVLKNILDRFKN